MFNSLEKIIDTILDINLYFKYDIGTSVFIKNDDDCRTGTITAVSINNGVEDYTVQCNSKLVIVPKHRIGSTKVEVIKNIVSHNKRHNFKFKFKFKNLNRPYMKIRPEIKDSGFVIIGDEIVKLKWTKVIHTRDKNGDKSTYYYNSLTFEHVFYSRQDAIDSLEKDLTTRIN